MSFALKIPDFFKAPPGGFVKIPPVSGGIPPIKPPGGFVGGIVGGILGYIIQQALFPPSTAQDALDEIGFKPDFFYEPPGKRQLQDAPFQGGQGIGVLYDIPWAAHGDNLTTTDWNPLQANGTGVYGKIKQIRIDTFENGVWVIGVPNPYQPIFQQPNGEYRWTNVNWRLWALGRDQPTGDDLWVQINGSVTPSIKFGNPIRRDGNPDNDGDPPGLQQDLEPILLKNTDTDDFLRDLPFPEPFPDLFPFPDPVKTPAPTPDPDPEPEPDKEPGKIGYPFPQEYPGREGYPGKGQPPTPVIDPIDNPLKPITDPEGRLDEGEDKDPDPEVTPLPPIVKVDFDCEKLKECMGEDEEQECETKKEDAELQTQTCELQEDGTYLTVNETVSLSVPTGMGEALSILNQQIMFLYEKACNASTDLRPIQSEAFSETDFVEVNQTDLVQVFITIVDDPRTMHIIPASRELQTIYFAGYFVWTSGGIPMSADIPIRRRNQTFLPPSGANGFFAYGDNAASIEGIYLYRAEE